MHDLRDTAASLWIKSGANVKVVQAQLGHESATMTLDRYAALFPDDLDEMAARLESAPPADSVRTLRAVAGISRGADSL